MSDRERQDELERGLYPFLYDEEPAQGSGSVAAEVNGRGLSAGADDSDAARPARRSARLAEVLDDVRVSTLQKCRDVVDLRRGLLDDVDTLVAAARDMAGAFADGGTLYAFGNGGSATDAQDLVADLLAPADRRPPLPAVSLVNDTGVVTAVANDVGFDNVFVRQLIAFARRGDIAFGISTSGSSRNVLVALERARSMGLVTVGLAGGEDGGGMAAGDSLDHCIVVPSSYVPRIQEVHATAYHVLVDLVHAALEAEELKRQELGREELEGPEPEPQPEDEDDIPGGPR